MANTATIFSGLEKASYRSRWRDGTLDLCGGLGVLAVGLAWQIELFWLTGFAVPVLMGLWFFLRRRVVEPRIGRVTFGQARRDNEGSSLKAGIWLGGGLLVFILAFYLLQTKGGFSSEFQIEAWIAALPVALLGLMALVAGAMAGLARFVGYAAVLVGTGVVGVMAAMEPAPQMLIAGAIITLVGGVLFFRFIVKHPVPSVDGVEG